MDGDRLSASDGRQHRDHYLSAVRTVRLSGIGRTIRELVAAAHDYLDRAVVYPVRHRGPLGARYGYQYLDPDRVHRARRARVQERDLDRRIRDAARRSWQVDLRRRDQRRTTAAAADIDDVF